MRRLNPDNGAAGVMIALSIAVLLGIAGLAIDIGGLYQERRVLSNGADAAALAIAEDCGLDVACDTGTGTATARSYANANADDGVSAVDSVVIDQSAQTVTVDLSSMDTEGNNVVEPYFAQVVGFGGATVEARAIAQWGFPSAVRNFLPLIISECEFPGAPSAGHVIYFHDGNNAEPCNAQAGHDKDGDGFLAGGFGWLVTDGGCESYLTVGDWRTADPGSSPANGCEASYIASLVGEEVPLPFFIDLDGVGAGGQYEISAFGLFRITGYNFGGQFKYPSGNPPCSGDERCLSGDFTTGAIYDGEFGGPDRGFVLVKLIG